MKESVKVNQNSLLQNKYFQKIFILRNTVQIYRILVVDGGGPINSALGFDLMVQNLSS